MSVSVDECTDAEVPPLMGDAGVDLLNSRWHGDEHEDETWFEFDGSRKEPAERDWLAEALESVLNEAEASEMKAEIEAAQEEEPQPENSGSAEEEDDAEDNEEVELTWPQFLESLMLESHTMGTKTELIETRDPSRKRRIGFIHPFGQTGLNLKATCEVHTDCKCWIAPNGVQCTEQRLWQDLAYWIGSGRFETAAMHMKAAVALKASYGQYPRKIH